MKKNNIFVLFMLGIFTLLLIPNSVVLADSLGSGLRSSNTGNLKPGDTFEVYYTIEGGIVPVFTEEVELFYDNDVLEPIIDGDNRLYQRVRNGWKLTTSSGAIDSIKGTVVCESEDCIITPEMISSNSFDDIYEILITYKFKVKNVENQKIQLRAVGKYDNPTLDLNIYQEDSNTNLNNLITNQGELLPAFQKDVTDYKITVDYNTTSIKLDATCEGNNCKVSELPEQQLNIGENRISIIVTAENQQKKTYNITVIREGASNDTTLSKLNIKDSNGKNLDIDFDAARKEYDFTVENDIIFVEVETACNGIECQIDEIGSKKLEVGKNTFTIRVTAQDQSSQEYKINIERLEKDNSSLYLIIGVSVIAVLVIGVVTFIIIKKKHNNRKQVSSLETKEKE